MKHYIDVVCQAYAGPKKLETIYQVLQTFIPSYQQLNSDYACKPDDPEYLFQSEDEMIRFFIENHGLSNQFYWNQYHDNPDRIMVGASITDDDKLIMSLTVDGTEETFLDYFDKLKNLLHTETGVISFFNPADYSSGEDFVKKYGPDHPENQWQPEKT